MPDPIKFKEPFFPDDYFHLVFKSIGDLLLFKNDENKRYFLSRYQFYFSDMFDCWAWCLLDNHLHMIIKLKAVFEIEAAIINLPESRRTVKMNKWIEEKSKDKLFDEMIEQQAGRMMVSYTNSYNKVFKRTGSLFQSPFRRSMIQDESHLQQAIIYVNANAQRHGLVSDFKKYIFSSYHEVLSNESLIVKSSEVIRFFGGRESFINLHEQQVQFYYTKAWPRSKIEVD